jgi:phage terminase large subunit-like protein
MRKATITAIERIEPSDGFVYNVKTANHNYFAGGVLVHNCDDGNDPNKVESDAIRNKSQKSFDDYSVTRRNNPKLAAVVNVQQRTHDRDISGSVLANADGWVTVVIAMEAETHERIEFPLSKRVIDRNPGDLMHPDRFPHDIISTLKRKPGIWAGRYQQRPNVSGGGIFKIRNWRLYVDYPESLDRTIMSVDAAFKGDANSDFVVVGVMGQRCNARQLPGIDGEAVWENEYYLPYRWRSQADIIRTEAAIGEVYQRFPQCYIKLIEDKANGPAIITRLSGVIPGITPYKPGADSKTTRAVAMQPVQERGDLLLPLADWAKDAVRSMGLDSISIGQWWDLYPPAHESDAEHAPVDDWVRSLIDEAAMFPNGQHDDQVDMFAQAVNWMEVQPNDQGWFGFGSTSAG